MSRANACQGTIKSGHVIIPHPDVAEWVRSYIKEMIGFPTASYDDQVDSTTQALNYVRSYDNLFQQAMSKVTV